MKAIVKSRPIDGQPWPEGLWVAEVPEPTVTHPEDVKVRVLAAGICGTDVGVHESRTSLRNSMARARKDPIVLGHEFCGMPTDAGSHARVRLARILAHQAASDPAVGEFVAGRDADRIAADPGLMEFLSENFHCSAEMHVTCGWCHQCRLGQRHVCQNTSIQGLHEDGAFADWVVVPAGNLILFRRNELPIDVIAFMDALGNAVHTVQAVDVVGKTVVILGAGVQGLMATAVARHSGASRIFITDFDAAGAGESHVEDRQFRLARRFGADYCFNVADPEARRALAAAVMEETGGTGVDAALEMSGSYGAYPDAFDLVRMGGVVALLGLPEGSYSLDFSRQIIFRGLTVKGVIGRRVFETWEAMRNLLRSGLAEELLASDFISHRLALEDFETGIRAILERSATKVILKP